MGLPHELEEIKKVHFGAGIDGYNTVLSDTAIRVATFLSHRTAGNTEHSQMEDPRRVVG